MISIYNISVIIFVIGSIYSLYSMYIFPLLQTTYEFKHDEQLLGHLSIVNTCKNFNPYNHSRAIYHLRRFFYYYTTQNNKKMQHHHYLTLKHLRQLPFYLHNDINLKHSITESIENINLILENYSFYLNDKLNSYYFGQYT